MPLITINLRGAELQGRTTVLLERGYKFSMLKLLHIYHNLDSGNLKDTIEKSEQAQLFVRLGGLIENSKQIINYVGDFSAIKSRPLVSR